MNQIVVGVDGSEGAAVALQWAAHEAELRGQPLVAVLAWDFLDQHHATGQEGFDPLYDEQRAAAALDGFVDAALGGGSDQVLRRVVCDRAAPALLEASREASLLVVGARGGGGFSGLLLGSVSEQCLHHATCPIAVVRDVRAGADGHVERIVVGVDGSEPARRALRWALDEGRRHKATVVVVHAWHLPVVGPHPFTAAIFDPALFEGAASRTLEAVVASEDAAGLPSPIQPVLVADGAASAVLTAAKDADLIVLGTRGRGGFTGLLLGSVSHKVAHHAHCPVVVVPQGD